jgi:predicted glycosyl hydrolase (DUF1957 family)
MSVHNADGMVGWSVCQCRGSWASDAAKQQTIKQQNKKILSSILEQQEITVKILDSLSQLPGSTETLKTPKY